MSNKTLVYVMGAIIVAGGISIWAVTRPGNTQKNLTYNELENQKGQEDLSDCNRDFSAETLKNAKIETKNRQVALDVQNFGTIELEFFDKAAPKTVENFLRLTNAGYYNCVRFHRVAKNFVIQGGDPTGSGSGGESAFGKEFADEINLNSDLYKNGYKKGYLAMANRGPNTNTSQFFIVLDDKAEEIFKDNKAYTIFGKVTSGMDVVEKIGQVDINPASPADPTDGTPVKPVIIKKATIIK